MHKALNNMSEITSSVDIETRNQYFCYWESYPQTKKTHYHLVAVEIFQIHPA